jgi:hypothetical protein
MKKKIPFKKKGKKHSIRKNLKKKYKHLNISGLQA